MGHFYVGKRFNMALPWSGKSESQHVCMLSLGWSGGMPPYFFKITCSAIKPEGIFKNSEV